LRENGSKKTSITPPGVNGRETEEKRKKNGSAPEGKHSDGPVAHFMLYYPSLTPFIAPIIFRGFLVPPQPHQKRNFHKTGGPGRQMEEFLEERTGALILDTSRCMNKNQQSYIYIYCIYIYIYIYIYILNSMSQRFGLHNNTSCC